MSFTDSPEQVPHALSRCKGNPPSPSPSILVTSAFIKLAKHFFLASIYTHLQTITELINPQWSHVDRSSSPFCTIIVPARLKLGVILAVGGGACVIESFTLDTKCACLLLAVILFLSWLQVTAEWLQLHLLNTAWADSVCLQCFNVCQTHSAQAKLTPLVIWCRTLMWLFNKHLNGTKHCSIEDWRCIKNTIICMFNVFCCWKSILLKTWIYWQLHYYYIILLLIAIVVWIFYECNSSCWLCHMAESIHPSYTTLSLRGGWSLSRLPLRQRTQDLSNSATAVLPTLGSTRLYLRARFRLPNLDLMFTLHQTLAPNGSLRRCVWHRVEHTGFDWV